ncbi:MAG: hypothetical protein PWQ86_2046, partial [Bacillota bacterium]|nr:hypothetical protein [Bacillota bacterium]
MPTVELWAKDGYLRVLHNSFTEGQETVGQGNVQSRQFKMQEIKR